MAPMVFTHMKQKTILKLKQTTYLQTLKEVKRCTREGIVINTFMLEMNYFLMEFMDEMAKINKGRSFYTKPDQLGRYMLVDYLEGRKRKV